MYFWISFSFISDLLGIQPDDVVQRLQQWGVECELSTVSRILDIILIITAIGVLYFLWRGLTFKQRRYVRNKVGAEYKHFNNRLSRWLFIDTFYVEKPLSDFDTPEMALREKGYNLVKSLSRNAFNDQDGNVLHLVLGGSGMGKSSFLVGLLRKYVMHHPWNRRYEIELVNLGREDCIHRIGCIQEKASTILLLDALDENRSAISSIEGFMAELEKEICNFPVVVITCRTHFFPNASSELQSSDLHGVGRYKDKLKYRHYYIRYFDDWDVKKYLLKKYPFYPVRYYKAKKAVSLCNSLAHRPLLLSYIDDIIKEKTLHLKNELDLYEKLIDLWIRRESNLLSANKGEDVSMLLELFSLRLAERMYTEYQNKGDYYVTCPEADAILAQLGIQGSPQSFKLRSLVERDAEGNYKFAHRTFMEFFLAKIAFKEDSFPYVIEGLDTVRRFFEQLCYRHIREQEEDGYIVRGKSDTFVEELDQIDIKFTRGGLRMKALVALPSIRILALDACDLKKVLPFIDDTSINYLRLSGYRKTEPLNPILSHPQIKYLWIDGDGCSKSFVKLASKQKVSVILNDKIVTYCENDDMPTDFLAMLKLSTDNSGPMFLHFIDFSETYDE